MLSIQVLGTIEVTHDGETLPLPNSRKTRALLGYLALTGAPQRRDRLCELFWDVPDDPRGSLRWSLSKLRPIVNRGGITRLLADRERVRLELDDVQIDRHRVSAVANDDAATVDELIAGWNHAGAVLLEDCDISKHDGFGAWLVQERHEVDRLRAQLARRIAMSKDLPPSDIPIWADRWLELSPFDAEAAARVVAARQVLGREAEAQRLADDLDRSFRAAGMDVPHMLGARRPVKVEKAVAETSMPVLAAPPQKVRFVTAQDGASLAWASVGGRESPPLVKAANWLSHLELDWEAPIWSPLFRNLAKDYQLVRYDERGCGLSDWQVPEISFETFVSDLELVVDSAGLERFPLLGISQGAAVSIEYAARHPERVSHLILFGGYPAGWRHTAPPEEVREREAVMVLTGSGWGRPDPTYRHIFSQTFMPDAAPDELDWFDEFQRLTTSPENAVRFLEAFAEIDVRDRLPKVKAPTLVIHSRGDKRIPLSTGRELAATIPQAEFVSLESNNHLLIGREPAADAFVSVVRNFLRS